MYSRLLAAQYVGFDTETTGLDTLAADFELVGLCFAIDTRTGYYLPLAHTSPAVGMLFDPVTNRAPTPLKQLGLDQVLAQLKPLLETKPLVGQNLKYDYKVMLRYGIKLNIEFDTLLAAHVADENGRHNLKLLTKKCFGYRAMEYNELGDEGDTYVDFKKVLVEDAMKYAAPDAVTPLRLMKLLKGVIDPVPGLRRTLYDVEMPLPSVIADMELVGFKLDSPHLMAMYRELGRKVSVCDATIKALGKEPHLNVASGQQMRALLYDKLRMKLPGRRKKGNKGLLEEETIKTLRSRVGKMRMKGVSKTEATELLTAYINRGKYAKARGTYTANLIEQISDDGRLHTDFLQVGTRGARGACSNPNLQNLPRNDDPDDIMYDYDIRKGFVADPGYVFLLSDYSMAEVCTCAGISGCQDLISIVTGRRRDAKGRKIDLHLNTACHAFHLDYDEAKEILGNPKHPRYSKVKVFRQKAKAINFGILYGITAKGLAREIEVTVPEAETLINAFGAAYPGVAKWMHDVKVRLRQQLYTETIVGRRRRIEWGDVKHDFDTVYKFCLNHIIQSTVGEIVKMAMAKVHRALEGTGAMQVLQIHDEILTLCPESIYKEVGEVVSKEMYYELNGVPLIADTEAKRTLSKRERPIWTYSARCASTMAGADTSK